MIDIVNKKTRSRMMSGIKGKNTKGELLIRTALHKKGIRYRLHRNDLPGKPDLVLSKYDTVIFINGCFWHGHGCHLFKWPKTRPEFWQDKITGNRRRDARNCSLLRDRGWRKVVVWECAYKGKTRKPVLEIASTIVTWLHSSGMNLEIMGESEG